MRDPQATVRISFSIAGLVVNTTQRRMSAAHCDAGPEALASPPHHPTPPRLHRLALRSWRSRATNNVENLRLGLWDGWGSIYKHRGRG